MVLRSGGVKKGCRDDVVSSEDTEDTVKIRGAGSIEGDEKVDRRGRVDRRGGPSGARTGKVSTLSSAHLREVARRPTACSLEHRARARFDEEHLLAVGELESATAADGHQTSIGWDKVRLEVEKWHRGVALATPQHRLPGPPFIWWACPSCADGRYGHLEHPELAFGERCECSCVNI